MEENCDCGNNSEEYHLCPYACEINNDHTTKCNCCEKCQQRCSDEI